MDVTDGEGYAGDGSDTYKPDDRLIRHHYRVRPAGDRFAVHEHLEFPFGEWTVLAPDYATEDDALDQRRALIASEDKRMGYTPPPEPLPPLVRFFDPPDAPRPDAPVS
jgi:hypothetical protein